MLSEIPFKIVYATGETEPIDFFFEALLESKSFDLALGFFNSSGINVLHAGFAFFILSGGKMRVIINDILSKDDKQAIENGLSKPDEYFEDIILDNFNTLSKTLSYQDDHFFKCLSYLISKKQIEFMATVPKNLSGGIAHNKFGIFSDEFNNKVAFNGSINFSKTALIKNIESISCYKSWSGEKNETARLTYFENYFNKIWLGKAENIRTIPIQKIKYAISENFPSPEIEQLISEENELIYNNPNISLKLNKKIIDRSSAKDKLPCFPYEEGPREYQKQAYENWIKNSCHGIFAMATGTGKTITSLNCVLEEYSKTNKYQVLIIVPTLTLVDQWIKEIYLFNFNNIVIASGGTDWRERLTKIKNDFSWGINNNFFIVTTYASFTDQTFQKILQKLPSEIILIADEAHNIGAPKVKEAFKRITFSKRIALSATPKRNYDPEGTFEIESFFNDSPPYVYNFSMKEAIENDFLTRYYYYPRLVTLTSDELQNYLEISKRLLKYFNSTLQEFKKCPEVEKLLLLRKQIIHKAINKLNLFQNIIEEINTQRELTYCFVYVPEGYGNQESGNKFSFIQEMVKLLYKVNPLTTSNTYLGGDSLRSEKLMGFAKGKINVLFAMKCLDEGVDIPKAQIGIFASSTGNPRQYIQRRGRLLRKSPGKHFAYIYDMIVVPETATFPNEFYNIERSLVRNELTRVAYFASLSQNFYDSKIALEPISTYFNLDLDRIINDL
jgi:superfamily II DNA or RNA helicase